MTCPWAKPIFNHGMKVFVRTYGCQMNVHDSEKILGVLSSLGYQPVSTEDEAHLVILNTCAVREKAEHKVYSELGRLKRLKRRGTLIGVCGCVAQKEGYSLLEKMPFVDFVVGPRNIYSLPRVLEEVALGRKVVETRLNGSCITSLEVPVIREDPYRAYVTVMEGCDNFCAYCVVPYTRGREVSRPSAEIVEEVRRLADQGYVEVTFLGQNVNSYGKGLEEGIDFPALLEKVHEVEGIRWIRFITSHPRDFSERLVKTVAHLPKVCEYIHLPAQAGSNRVLERMGRGYTREEYLEKVAMIREYVPGAALTSDFIVGFPGETEEDFQLTLDLVKEARYEGIFAFRYSVREGTKAARWKDDVPLEVKGERLTRLLELQDGITQEMSQAYQGKVVDVLFHKWEDGVLEGRTRTNKIVTVPGDRRHLGTIKRVKIGETRMYQLLGTLAEGGDSV